MTVPAYGPGYGRLTREEAQALIVAHIEDMRWWVLPIIGNEAGDFADILETFVNGEIDYLCGPHTLSFAFVQKRLCPADDMARLLNAHCKGTRISPEQLETQSIILIGDR